mgnify:CR=1 FL=1
MTAKWSRACGTRVHRSLRRAAASSSSLTLSGSFAAARQRSSKARDTSAQPVQEMTDAQWRQTIAINLDGVFYLTRRAIPHLRDGSAIVNDEDGRLLGIFTATDALNALVEVIRGTGTRWTHTG